MTLQDMCKLIPRPALKGRCTHIYTSRSVAALESVLGGAFHRNKHSELDTACPKEWIDYGCGLIYQTANVMRGIATRGRSRMR